MISLIVVVLVVGFVAWLIQTLLPVAQPFKTAAMGLLGLLVLLYVLSFFGVLPAGRWSHL